MTHQNPSLDELRNILTRSKTIALVGASSSPERESHAIMKRLMASGYRVIPVNPKEEQILGQKSYPSLGDIPEAIDIVDIFRRAEDTPPIAEEAVRVGAKVLWLQLGISNEDAAARATAGGLIVIMDRCIGRTLHELGMEKARDGR
jgi:predicted CoA-binding protein